MEGYFWGGLLLAPISSQGRAEFASQEGCVLSSTAARLEVGAADPLALLTGSSPAQDQAAGSYKSGEGSVGLKSL